jgi:hypothetical protein
VTRDEALESVVTYWLVKADDYTELVSFDSVEVGLLVDQCAG